MKYKLPLLASMTAIILLTSSLAFSQSAEDLKKQSLQVCEAQVAQLPEEQKAQVLSICNCTIENTDYEKVLKYSQEGNLTKVQEDAIKVAQECQAKLQ